MILSEQVPIELVEAIRGHGHALFTQLVSFPLPCGEHRLAIESASGRIDVLLEQGDEVLFGRLLVLAFGLAIRFASLIK